MVLYNRKIYNKITWHLYNYKDYANGFLEAEEDIIHSKSYRITHNNWIQSKNKESNTVENQAIDLASLNSTQSKKMIDAISKAVTIYEREDILKYKIIGLKYFKQMSEEYILKELHIERSSYFTKCSEILNLIALFATANRSNKRK